MLEFDIPDYPAVLLHLGVGINSPWVPRPPESHHSFGSGFILLSMLMVAERLSGSVWYRSRFRMMIFPATLVILGWGMLAVTAIEPRARMAHLAMGTPMIVGGWAEARYRLGQLPRSYADLFIIPALFFAAVDTAAFHLSGSPTSPGFLTHASLAVTAVMLAGFRYYESGDVASLGRGLTMSMGVLLIAFELYADALFL
jgi:hypothetical protein